MVDIPLPRSRTLSHVLSLYATEMLPTTTTRTQYQRRLLFAHWQHTLGDMPLAAVTPSVLHCWRNDLLCQGLAPRTVQQRMFQLQRVLGWAQRQGWLATNPMRAVEKPKPLPEPPRVLTPAERQRLLTVCEASTHPHLYAMVLLSLSTGLQKGQVQSLTWDAVHLDGCRSVLYVTRGGAGRALPLEEGMVEVLAVKQRTRDPAVPWVFPRRDGQQPITFQRAWHNARIKAGLPGYRFDWLRYLAPRTLRLALLAGAVWQWGSEAVAWGVEATAALLSVVVMWSGL